MLHLRARTLRVTSDGICALRRQELQARMQRLDGAQERHADRAELLDLLSLSVLYSRLCSDEAPFERKAMRAALDVHTHVRPFPSVLVSLTCTPCMRAHAALFPITVDSSRQKH